jgi:hypothetical protein
MEKIFNQKNLIIVFGHLWVVEETYIYIYAFKFTFRCLHFNYLPPVSTTQGELVAKFAADVVDTSGKFAAGVVDTGGNLPPVSLTPVVHLDLQPENF